MSVGLSQAAFGCDGIGLDTAGTHVLERIGRGVEDHVDPARHQILHRRAEASIGYERKARAGFLLEEDADEMRVAAHAASPGRRLVRVRLEPGDQLPQILRRHGLPCDDQHRFGDQQRDRLEILQQVALKRIDRAIENVRSPVAEDERVAIACRASDSTAGDTARGTSHVFDDAGWPSDTRMRSARMRAVVSAGPPAWNPTTIVIGRDG